MESNEKHISQKDYLKKYLSKDKGEKKKKKVKISSSSHLKRSIIIDDDLGLPNVASIDDEEFNLDYLGDEAPQVAGIIDERPLEIRAKESHGSNRWKPVGEPGESEVVNTLLDRISKHSSDKNDLNGKSHRKEGTEVTEVLKEKQDGSSKNYKRDDDSDLSPRRTNVNKLSDSESDVSPPKKKGKDALTKYRENESDLTSQRKKGKEYQNKYNNSDSDLSPRRKKERERHKKDQDSDSDLSPPRKKGKEHQNKYQHSDSDLSPPRKKEKYIRNKYQNGNLSPSRIKTKSKEDRRESAHIRNAKYNKRSSDSDLSPARKRNELRGREGKHKPRDPESEQRKKRQQNDSSDSDLSPERISKFKSLHRKDSNIRDKSYRRLESYASKGRDDDRNRRRIISPSRATKKKNVSSDSDLSPPRRHNYENRRKEKSIGEMKRKSRDQNSDSDLSPPRRGQKEKYRPEAGKMKMDKTLDGKKAGLQDAKNLKEELKQLKEAEDVAFSKLQASVSGRNASAVMRDRKTGKIRDLEKEKQEIIEKSAKQIEREKKYEKWGKGLKQVEEAEERLAEVLHEMNKPLARYAGDDDLENMLKSREREGDPMLDYIRSKQAESISLDNAGKPKYQGHFMPNRFGIRPGHRWDGVDRSNGYEKSWFERQNAKKAIQEEAYKWSTSDM